MDFNGLADPYVKLHLLPGACKVFAALCFCACVFFSFRSTGFCFFLIFQLELMKVIVQTNKFPLKRNGLLAGKNIFPVEAARCLQLCEKALSCVDHVHVCF